MSEKTFLFDVTGMHCQGCAKKITDSLLGRGLAKNLEVDVAKGKVVVVAGEGATSMSLKNEIEKLGFKVSKFELKK